MAKCYVMIEDAPGGLIYGADFGLEEGEELPEDVEELTEAQFTAHCFMATLRGTLDDQVMDSHKAEVKEGKPGLLVPDP